MAKSLGWRYEKAAAEYRDLRASYAAAHAVGGKGLKKALIEAGEGSQLEELYLTYMLTVAHSARVVRDLKGVREAHCKKGKKLGAENSGAQLRLGEQPRPAGAQKEKRLRPTRAREVHPLSREAPESMGGREGTKATTGGAGHSGRQD